MDEYVYGATFVVRIVSAENLDLTFGFKIARLLSYGPTPVIKLELSLIIRSSVISARSTDGIWRCHDTYLCAFSSFFLLELFGV